MQTIGYAAFDSTGTLRPWEFQRRAVGPNDVLLEIHYAGICHSDIHQVRNEWKSSKYPMVPGHEIIGKITQVGANVTKFKVGEHAGVGCMVNSCRDCHNCKNHEEQYCDKGAAFTYNGTEMDKKTPTYGGYSRHIVVDSDFVIRVSEKFKDFKPLAPLLCAGITVYSPLAHWRSLVTKGKKVAINGLGGLGHMGVKFAASFGAEVTVFSTSSSKEGDATKLGAHHFVNSKDPKAMEKVKGTFDFILDTVAADHPLEPLITALGTHGVIVLVGAPPDPLKLNSFNLIFGGRIIAGSLIGGVKETQEMMDYCADHGIASEIEMISIDKVNEAFDRAVKSDVKYRFVIDTNTIHKL